MENVDYIIVGDGYAALFFAHQLIKNQHSFKLYSSGKKGASQVSAGIVNPVVLKKFTTFWKAQEQLDQLRQTLGEMKTYLHEDFLIEEPIHRIFHDEKEKELWLKKRAKHPELQPFLNPDFKTLEGIENPFGTGEVWQSARLNVSQFFSIFLDYLKNKQYLVEAAFDYEKLNPEAQTYEGFHYRHLIFAEGMGVLENPYFKNIAVHANKGHHLSLELSTQLPSAETIKKKHFLFPQSQGGYYYGGTYDREATSQDIDETAVAQLKAGLEAIYPHDYRISAVHYGSRPTVKDRRPLLGAHQDFPQLYVFNGLGARGILNGCYFSDLLYQFVENQKPLPKEVDWQRF